MAAMCAVRNSLAWSLIHCSTRDLTPALDADPFQSDTPDTMLLGFGFCNTTTNFDPYTACLGDVQLHLHLELESLVLFGRGLCVSLGGEDTAISS